VCSSDLDYTRIIKLYFEQLADTKKK